MIHCLAVLRLALSHARTLLIHVAHDNVLGAMQQEEQKLQSECVQPLHLQMLCVTMLSTTTHDIATTFITECTDIATTFFTGQFIPDDMVRRHGDFTIDSSYEGIDSTRVN